MSDRFLFIDKEKGKTSFDVVRDVKKALSMKKVGHAGTLDPMATGLMIVATGEATKLLEFLLHYDKVYEGDLRFGATSDTYDAEGSITEFNSDAAFMSSLSVIKKIVQERFIGKISQVPPKFSAKKVNGKRAYDLARKGEDFTLQAKEVNVYGFEILSFVWPDLKFRISCGSGTYIRSLVHDLGQALSCGAYMTSLRRVSIGRFSLADVGESGVSIEDVFSDFPFIDIDDEEYVHLSNGRFVPNKKSIQDVVFLAKYKGKVVGVAELVTGGEFIKFRKRLNVLV